MVHRFFFAIKGSNILISLKFTDLENTLIEFIIYTKSQKFQLVKIKSINNGFNKFLIHLSLIIFLYLKGDIKITIFNITYNLVCIIENK